MAPKVLCVNDKQNIARFNNYLTILIIIKLEKDLQNSFFKVIVQGCVITALNTVFNNVFSFLLFDISHLFPVDPYPPAPRAVSSSSLKIYGNNV